MTIHTPAFFGLSGLALTAEERALFGDAAPAGYILFARNIADRVQLRALTDDLRTLSGREDVPILIDQEGGRVARMRAPEWPSFPAGNAYAALYERAPASAIAAARANAEAIALTLAEVGVNVNCLPVLDVASDVTHAALGDRAMSDDPMRVAALGRAVLEGLQTGGVVGVAKHIPGHGRAAVDSHHELPVVDASEAELERDITPFRTLNWAPMAMTTHVLYPVWDGERPATQSPRIVGDIIRGRIGFDGLLMTDDLDMHALTGTKGERAALALDAGVDIALQCNGDIADMRDVVDHVGGRMTDAAQRRLGAAMAGVSSGPEFRADRLAQATETRDALLALA